MRLHRSLTETENQLDVILGGGGGGQWIIRQREKEARLFAGGKEEGKGVIRQFGAPIRVAGAVQAAS